MKIPRDKTPRRLRRYELFVMFAGYVSIFYILIRLVVYLLVKINDWHLLGA